MKKKIKYPVKLGFKDGSGKEENWITDQNENVLIHGWGDCCKIGGIQRKDIANILINLLNKKKPIIYFDIKMVEKRAPR